jgi:radical SAM superfamily enzyme YgiQ (UPF0313 family)
VVESLKETAKFQNLRKDLLESVKLIQAYGMEVMAGFIVGLDNDPPDVFERQIAFIREAAIPLSMVGLLTALPNTQLWRHSRDHGAPFLRTRQSHGFKLGEALDVDALLAICHPNCRTRQFYGSPKREIKTPDAGEVEPSRVVSKI